MSTDTPRLVTIGCDHHKTPLEVRERLALSADGVRLLQEELKQHPGILEGVVLNTCNRIEIHTVSKNGDSIHLISGLLGKVEGFPVDVFLEHAYTHKGEGAIYHAFRLAAGLDSQMIGETQIL